jgi:methionine-rich copper-binding protein CopC
LIKTQATSNNSTLALLQNPVQQTLAFSFTSSNSTSNEIAVYNLVGLKVYAQKLGVQKGNNSVSLQLNNNLNPGTYILEVKNNTERTTTKFIKQ